jgi:PKHD-type hydroxylase
MSRHTVYRLFESAIPIALCELILEEGRRLSFDRARLRPDAGKDYVDETIRLTDLAFWPPSHWISGLLIHYATLANHETWGYRLAMSQGVQLGRYENGGTYDWHKDEFDMPFGDEAPPPWRGLSRKITVVANLSDPAGYEGGQLLFKDTFGREIVDEAEQSRIAAQGSVIVFPAYVVHTVKPVTRGTRHSLASWIVGPPFS